MRWSASVNDYRSPTNRAVMASKLGSVLLGMETFKGSAAAINHSATNSFFPFYVTCINVSSSPARIGLAWSRTDKIGQAVKTVTPILVVNA